MVTCASREGSGESALMRFSSYVEQLNSMINKKTFFPEHLVI